MRFIKLTDSSSSTPVYINIADIVIFGDGSGPYVVVRGFHEPLTVAEGPDEIAEMLGVVPVLPGNVEFLTIGPIESSGGLKQ